MVVSGAGGFVEFFFGFFVYFLALAFELLQLDFYERTGGGFAAHDRIARCRPGENETRVVGFAAHGVVTCAEAAATNHRNLRHHGIGHRVDHFCAGADDAGPLGVFADHEAVDVVEENQWDAVLIAVENEASGFFRGFGVDDAPKLDALLVGVRRGGLHVLFLIGDDADRPAADAGIATKQRFAVFVAVLFEFAGVDDAGNDFAHVVLLGRVARENSVNFVGGI